jgi:uncharacterized protein (UPF0332 family)
MKAEDLKKRIERYIKKEQLTKREEFTKLKNSFLQKSRKNFTVANLQFKISEDDEIKNVLALPKNFETYEWTIIVSYYAMYISALAALASIKFKSKSHAATICVLRHYFVNKHKDLKPKHIEILTKAEILSSNLISKLTRTKTRREVAQYEATPEISRINAIDALKDAEEFITKIEEIIS